MIKLVIDSQKKRIILRDTEIDPVSRNDDRRLHGRTELWYGINENEEKLEFASFYLNSIDFEGFVLEMIDHNGFSFITEIPGLS